MTNHFYIGIGDTKTGKGVHQLTANSNFLTWWYALLCLRGPIQWIVDSERRLNQNAQIMKTEKHYITNTYTLVLFCSMYSLLYPEQLFQLMFVCLWRGQRRHKCFSVRQYTTQTTHTLVYVVINVVISGGSNIVNSSSRRVVRFGILYSSTMAVLHANERHIIHLAAYNILFY